MEQFRINNLAEIFPQSVKAGIYCRLSQDDDCAGDSSSILTQKMILTKFCEQNEIKVYDTYVDDGYSGLNFNRPSFQRLLGDIEKGLIDSVITKDLSRLGRDYIQTGYYTEVYFQSKNVRYIAVNDGVDTLYDNNDIAPFKNILNDMYAKDLSKKVKSAKRQRMLAGMYVSAQTPYGYKQDPNNKNKLVIDDDAAEVVREIFKLAVQGCGAVKVLKHLTDNRIITPGAYKAERGDTRFDRFYSERLKYKWNQNTVLKIMRDRVYCGDMENHKYEVKNYKTKKCTRVPKDQHIIVENTHAPIITREVYESVQNIITAKHRPKVHEHPNIFKGIVFCAECGYRLHLFQKPQRDKVRVKPEYRCFHHFTYPNECTHHNYIHYENLYNLVYDRLKREFKLLSENRLVDTLQSEFNGESKNKKLLATKTKIELRLENLVKIIKKLFEENVGGVIDDSTYNKLQKEYADERKTLSDKLVVITAELSKKDEFAEKLAKLKETVNNFLNFEELTAEMLNLLIERIEITHRVKHDSGEITQDVKIIYRFISSELQ